MAYGFLDSMFPSLEDDQKRRLMADFGLRLLGQGTQGAGTGAGLAQAGIGSLGTYGQLRDTALKNKLMQQQIAQRQADSDRMQKQQMARENVLAKMHGQVPGDAYMPAARGRQGGAIGMPPDFARPPPVNQGFQTPGISDYMMQQGLGAGDDTLFKMGAALQTKPAKTEIKRIDEGVDDQGRVITRQWLFQNGQKVRPLGPPVPKTGQTINNIIGPEGNISLDPAVKRELQKDLVSAEGSAARFQKLTKDFDEDYFKWSGKLKSMGVNVMEKAGLGDLLPEEAKEFTRKRKVYVAAVEREFNRYRVEVTGAAAALAEIEQLKAAFINKDLGPTEFRGMLHSLSEEMNRGRRIKNRLMRLGLDDINSEDYTTNFDKFWAAGVDDDPEEHGNYLKELNPSWSDDDIWERLKTEGYF